MARRYQKHGSAFKLKVALEALKEQKTTAELCQEFRISQSQLFAWKKELEENGLKVFEGKKEKKLIGEVDRLHRVIGKLMAENDFLERALKQ